MSTMEYERKFLVARTPVLPAGGSQLRQGYLATDGDVAVRIRAVDGTMHRLTVKGGRGAVRTEVECDLSAAEFAALWPLTDGRRVDKTRYVVTLAGALGAPSLHPGSDPVAEVDVFHGTLEGLVLVEVEFADEQAMVAFEPPEWFGAEVTDDRRYTNAALATSGRPDD